MERTFFVQIEGEDPIVVAVKDDVNRPNNMDCDSVLETGGPIIMVTENTIIGKLILAKNTTFNVAIKGEVT